MWLYAAPRYRRGAGGPWSRHGRVRLGPFLAGRGARAVSAHVHVADTVGHGSSVALASMCGLDLWRSGPFFEGHGAISLWARALAPRRRGVRDRARGVAGGDAEALRRSKGAPAELRGPGVEALESGAACTRPDVHFGPGHVAQALVVHEATGAPWRRASLWTPLVWRTDALADLARLVFRQRHAPRCGGVVMAPSGRGARAAVAPTP